MIRPVQLKHRWQCLTLKMLQDMTQPTDLKPSVLTCNKVIYQQLKHNMAITLNTAFK
jgi:hypothetical protein